MTKIAIIGAGRMGITHYSIINSHPGVEVISVADPSPLVLKMMNKYLPVLTFKNYDDLFEHSAPEAVLVCTSPALHFPIIKKAAQRGAHVFVEKPFTTRYSDATELAEMYSALHLVNQVGYVNRFNDVFSLVREYVDCGLIGKVIRFKSEMFSCTISRADESSGWRARRETGGGALLEMASHAIDLVNYLIGKPDKVVGSSLNRVYSKNVEDTVSSTFLYKNGICGTIYINWSDTSFRKPTNKIEIFGDGGRILADQYSMKIYMNRPSEQYKFQHGWNSLFITDIFKPVPFYVRGNEFTNQLYHFVKCIQDKDFSCQCSFADGVNVLEIIEKIITDYELNGRV
jgi:predicted dehydrogenase